MRRRMAAAAGKKSTTSPFFFFFEAQTTSLSLFMETYGLEVEEELSTVAIQYWAEGVWTGKWRHEQKEAWMRQNSRSSDVETGERACRSSDV